MTYDQGIELIAKVSDLGADVALLREALDRSNLALGGLFTALCVIAFFTILTALRK